MVSSVLVEFVGDDGIGCSITGEGGEACKCVVFGDVALCVGKEDMFGMEVESVPFGGHEDHARNFGDTGTPPKFIKTRSINIGSRFFA